MVHVITLFQVQYINFPQTERKAQAHRQYLTQERPHLCNMILLNHCELYNQYELLVQWARRCPLASQPRSACFLLSNTFMKHTLYQVRSCNQNHCTVTPHTHTTHVNGTAQRYTYTLEPCTLARLTHVTWRHPKVHLNTHVKVTSHRKLALCTVLKQPDFDDTCWVGAKKFSP